jgi:hypothetical protein
MQPPGSSRPPWNTLQVMAFLTFLGLCTERLGCCMLTKALSPCVAEIIQARNEFPAQERWSPDTLGPPQWGGGTCLSLGKGLPSTSPGWNYPRWVSKLLEIRLPKTTGVTIKDTETENCLSKAKFTSAEGSTGTWAQHAHRVDHRSAFLSLMVGPCPFTQMGQYNLLMIG